MDSQEMLSLIEDVVRHEEYEMRPELMEEGLVFDIEATRDAIFERLRNNIRAMDYIYEMPQQWQREEYVHIVALDYFSMYEPVFKELEMGHA